MNQVWLYIIQSCCMAIFTVSYDLTFSGSGTVHALQVDSKKDLEKLLKATCEVFIMAVTKLTVEPMLSFITKVTAVRVASSLNSGKRLREQVSAFSVPAAHPLTYSWSTPASLMCCSREALL